MENSTDYASHAHASRTPRIRAFRARRCCLLLGFIAVTTVSEAREDCLVRIEGQKEVTYYCVDGFTCNIPQWKCDPGPEERARLERNKWSGQKDDCESAGEFERQTAAWYYACVLDSTQISRVSSHKPVIDPAELSRNAKNSCRGSASVSTCVSNAKRRMILAADPGIAQACSGRRGFGFVECVDQKYLYGTDGRQALSERLAQKIYDIERQKRKDWQTGGAPVDRSKLDKGPRPQGCPPGYGMKPDRSAFGAWTCQPLNVVLWPGKKLDFDAPAEYPEDEREAAQPVEAFEDRLNRLVFEAVASAARGDAGSMLSQKERDDCVAEAFEAVRAVFKGGAPQVSSICRGIAGVARGELMRQAEHGSGDPSIQELLAGLAERTGAAIQDRQDDCFSADLDPEELRKCLLSTTER